MGGAGFIGSHLTEALLREGHEVTVFDKIGIKRDNIAHILPDIKFIEGDFLDEHFTGTLPDGMDYVFHLVSTTLPATSNKNPVYDVTSNLAPSVHLIQACAEKKIKKFFFISSGGTVYGVPKDDLISEKHPTEPINSYAITKLSIEKFLGLYKYLHGLDYTVLRVANPYGPRQPYDKPQGVIAVFMSRILNDKPLEIWGDGNQLRDYLYIEDTIEAFLTVLKKETPSDVYNFGSSIGISVNDIINQLKDITGRDFEVIYNDTGNVGVPKNVLDSSRAKEELGWAPKTELKDGLKKTWEWFSDKLGK